jgi:hypothetical protein
VIVAAVAMIVTARGRMARAGGRTEPETMTPEPALAAPRAFAASPADAGPDGGSPAAPRTLSPGPAPRP